MHISVIIPTHNRAHTLPRALDSVLAQTLPATQVILVDDGSSDATASLIRQRYPDIDYYYQPNRGVSAARNLGIRQAKGEWIALLDSDDEWLPAKLAAQCEGLKQHPGLRLCHTEEIWIRQGRRVNPMKKHAKTGGRIYLNCLPRCVISPSSALIHRSLLEQVGLFDEALPACEDYDLWLRICALEEVCYLDTPYLIKHGGHEDQLSQRHWGMDRFRLIALERMLPHPQLSPQERQATLDQLRQKIEILALGADKRGKTAEAQAYRARLDQLPTGLSL